MKELKELWGYYWQHGNRSEHAIDLAILTAVLVMILVIATADRY